MGRGQIIGDHNWLKRKIDKIDNPSLSDVAVPLLLTEWTENEDGTFTQSASVDGLDDGFNPIVILSPVENRASEDELKSYACISDVLTADNTITFIASKKPLISFTVIVKSVTASNNSAIADVTALVGKVSELETGLENSNNAIDTLTTDLETANQTFSQLNNNLNNR